MPWFVIDDNADSHPKFVAAKNAAIGLWARAGAYVSRHLTDGIVPGDVAKMFGSTPQITRLVAVGLWHAAGHDCPHPKCRQPAPGDYYMHDYLLYNPSRAEVLSKRERAAEKKRGHRARQESARGEQAAGRTPQPTAAPDPAPARERPPAPVAAAPISSDWQPSDNDVQAAQLARADAGRDQLTRPQLDAVTRKFIRRMSDDGVRAAGFGGRWQQWAENERVEVPPASASGDVIPFGRRSPQQQSDDMFGAAMERAQARMNEGGR